jgi:hypothetical protein
MKFKNELSGFFFFKFQKEVSRAIASQVSRDVSRDVSDI